MIIGKSGSGKSTLGLQLLAYGAGLIADDRTALACIDGRIIASAPDNIAGLIEARGMGVLNAAVHPPATVACVIDLDCISQERIPAPKSITISGVEIPMFARSAMGDFAASVMQFLRAGMSDK